MAATDLRIRISADNQASAGLRQVQQSMKDLDRQSKAVRDSLSGLGVSLKGFAAGFIGLQGLQEAASAFIRVNVETDKLRANLVTATGSVEAASRAWNDLSKFAATTPYAVNEVVDAFIKLKNYGLDPTKETMIAYGNIASSMGKTLMQWADAVGDAVTGQFDRLPEFGIKAKKDGETVAFTFRGITKEVGNNAQEIEQYLRNLGNVEFAGAMERQTKTLGASVDRLKETWEDAWRKMGDAGLTNAAKGVLADFTRLVGEAGDFWAEQFTKIRNQDLGVGFQSFSGPTDELRALNEAIAKVTAEAKARLEELNKAKEALTGANGPAAQDRAAMSMGAREAATVEIARQLYQLEERRKVIIDQIARAAAQDYEERLAREKELAARAQEIIDASNLVGKDWLARPPEIEFKLDPKLDKVNPELATNVTLALEKAASEGIEAGITSGFRETIRQAQIWAEAVKKYGSVEIARKYVAPPGSSMHEKGEAVDVVIRGYIDEEDMKRKAKRMGEIFQEFGLIAPVATENFANPNKGLIHIQLAEDQARQTKTTQGLSAAQKEYNALLAEGARIYEQTRTPVEALAIKLQELDALYQQGAIKDQETYYRAVAQAQDDFIAGVQRLQAELERSTGPAAALEQAIIQLNAAYQAGKLGKEAYVRAVVEAQDAFGKGAKRMADDTDQVRDASVRMQEAAQEIGNSLAMAFEEAIVQAKDLQSILKALLQDIARAILRKGVTENLGNSLGDFVKKLFGFANGGIMSSQGPLALPRFALGGVMTKHGAARLPAFAQGGIMTTAGPLALPRFALGGVMTGSGPLPLRRYATGGIATTPQLALFGEGRTPEAYVPLPDGRSIPVSFKEQVAAAPAVTLDVTVNNLPGQSAQVTQDSQGGLTIEIVRAQLANDMQRGGVPWVTSLERRYGMTRGRG